MSSLETDSVSVEQETIFSGPFSIEQLGWFGGGLLVLFFLLAIRDFMFARNKWIVPFLFVLRSVACAGIFLALAAPVKTTRRTYKTGTNTLGIYVDSSPSMRLRDPVDGEGHLTRWHLATGNKKQETTLGAIDRAGARIGVARALLGEAVQNNRDSGPAFELLREQLEYSLEVFTSHQTGIPYPDLSEEVCELLHIASGSKIDALLKGNPVSPGFGEKVKALQYDIDEILNRGAAISRELARREESGRKGEGADEEPSRLEWAGELMKIVEMNTVASLGDDLEVLRYQFSDYVSPVSDEWQIIGDEFPEETTPSAESGDVFLGTDLNAALKQVEEQYRAGQVDAAIVVTDAVHNEVDGGLLEVPPALKHFPLFLVPAGGDFKLSDVMLWRVSAPKTIGQGDFLSVDCLVGARGFPGQSTRLRLLENGKELDSQVVTFGEEEEDQNFRLTTPVTTTGSHRFEVEITPLSGELNTRNNREFFDLNVYTGDLEVLMVDGWPRWETRYLGNLLRRDENMDHREVLFAPDPPDPYPDVLSSLEKLASFNIVVLGEVGQDFLGVGEIAALENYVNEGGNLIVMAGQEVMPAAFENTKLAEILPVQLDRKRPSSMNPLQLVPTPAGRRIAALSLEDDRIQNDAVWRLGSTLLPLTEISPFNIPKPGAQVILEARLIGDPDAGGQPATREGALPYLVWHRYGAGRVFYFSSPTTYFLRYRFGDRYHYRFWGQFLRWSTMAEMLQGQASIQVSTAAKRYSDREKPRIEVELRDAEGEPVRGANVGISLEATGGSEGKFPCAAVPGKAGIYGVTLPPLEHGEYRIEAIGPTVEKLVSEVQDEDDFLSLESGFIVEAMPNLEDGDRTCDWESAQDLVDATGGALIPPQALQSAIEVLARKKAIASREEITNKPLWNRWSLFFLILLFLTLEWAGRKFAGLI